MPERLKAPPRMRKTGETETETLSGELHTTLSGQVHTTKQHFDRPLLYQVLPVNIIFSPVGTLGRERVTQLLSNERIGYLQGLPSFCHLLWDSQTPQSTEIHMLRCVFPGPTRGSQHFPKGVLQSLSFLHCCRGSVARFQPMPGHTTPPIPSEGRGKQLSSHACYSAPEGHFHKVQTLGWKTWKNFIMPQAFLLAP